MNIDLNGFELFLTQRPRSRHTVVAYLSDSTQFSKWLAHKSITTPRQIDPQLVVHYLNFLAHNFPLIATLRRKRAALKALISWYAKENKLAHKPSEYLYIPLSSKTLYPLAPTAQLPLRDQLLIMLLQYHSVSYEQLLSLQFKDIELPQQRITLTTPTRTTITVHPDCCLLLQRYRETFTDVHQDKRLFDFELASLRQHIKKIFKHSQMIDQIDYSESPAAPSLLMNEYKSYHPRR